MKKLMFGVAVALASLAGCKSDAKSDHAGKVEADNTAKNERDTKTADTAVETSSDLDMTQEIRQAIMADDSLSTNAHNAKIVVENGAVTLVGPVASADEKAKLEQIASRVAPKAKVTNQLEVTN